MFHGHSEDQHLIRQKDIRAWLHQFIYLISQNCTNVSQNYFLVLHIGIFFLLPVYHFVVQFKVRLHSKLEIGFHQTITAAAAAAGYMRAQSSDPY